MERWVVVRNRSRNSEAVLRARWCSGFWSRLRGLTFRRDLAPGEGVVLVESRPGRLGTAIHMWGMWMDLGVVWLDAAGRVVDRKYARRGGIYLPKRAAQYVLEGQPSLLEHVRDGDEMEFLDAPVD